jgi:hypothetical protein
MHGGLEHRRISGWPAFELEPEQKSCHSVLPFRRRLGPNGKAERIAQGSRGWAPRLYGQPTPPANGERCRYPGSGAIYRTRTERVSAVGGGQYRSTDHPDRDMNESTSGLRPSKVQKT